MKKITVANRKELIETVNKLISDKDYILISNWSTHCELKNFWTDRIITVEIA